MKKLVSLALAAMICLGLCACGAKQAPFDVTETSKTLLKTPGVFSEELAELDRAVLDALYGVEEPDGVTDAVSYVSTGATAEELTVLAFEDEKAAEAFQSKALSHIGEVREANESYRPQEMPKLEKALVERRGASILVLVCADLEAAEALLN